MYTGSSAIRSKWEQHVGGTGGQKDYSYHYAAIITRRVLALAAIIFVWQFLQNLLTYRKGIDQAARYKNFSLLKKAFAPDQTAAELLRLSYYPMWHRGCLHCRKRTVEHSRHWLRNNFHCFFAYGCMNQELCVKSYETLWLMLKVFK